MKTLPAAFTLATLLLLAGCTSSPGDRTYYDRKYDYGQEGRERPVVYNGTFYGEAVPNRSYGNAASTSAHQYSERSYEQMPDIAGALNAVPRSGQRCNCIQASSATRKGSPTAAAHDPSWDSTYYAIGP